MPDRNKKESASQGSPKEIPHYCHASTATKDRRIYYRQAAKRAPAPSRPITGWTIPAALGLDDADAREVLAVPEPVAEPVREEVPDAVAAALEALEAFDEADAETDETDEADPVAAAPVTPLVVLFRLTEDVTTTDELPEDTITAVLLVPAGMEAGVVTGAGWLVAGSG